MEQIWTLEPGDRRTRAELKQPYGVDRMRGINVSRETGNVILLSSPKAAEANGYDFDGWEPGRAIFRYTGQGPVGDQKWDAGNSAVRDHAQAGMALRVFVADGRVDGRDTTIHQYVGQFELDPDEPYVIENAPGRKDKDRGDPGAMRSVIVFRMRPVDALEPEESYTSPEPAEPAETQVLTVPLEAHRTETFDRAGSKPGTGRRAEAGSVQAFADWLMTKGHTIVGKEIARKGSIRHLRVDLYDETEKVLYEAKSSSETNAVRLALGQILDYRRDFPDSSSRVFLPTRPKDTMVELLKLYDVGLAYPCPDTKGSYIFDD